MGFELKGYEREDLIQEGSIALVKAIKTYSPDKGANFKTYATTCIKNGLVTLAQNDSAEKNKLLNEKVDIEPLAETLPSNLYDELAAYEEREHYESLDKKIKNILSDLEYEILHLYIEGYSYKEIGSKVGKTAKTADNAVQRIRKKIREAEIL